MRVDELRDALQTASATQAAVDDALDAVMARRAQRRRNAIGIGTVVALVVVAVTVGVVTRSTGDGDDEPLITDQVGDVRPAVAGEWERLPDPPLSPRSHTTMVWTGEEVLVLGGDEIICLPGTEIDCVYESPVFADGAAFDPETGTWRPIAEAPVPFNWAADTVVFGDDVYLWAERLRSRQPSILLRYSITDDTWEEMEPPEGDRYSGLTATNTGVVANAQGGWSETAAVIFDPETSTWTPLPSDPLVDTYDRMMVWIDPHLFLFAREWTPPEPPVAKVARFDTTTGRWEELPPKASVGFPGGIAVGTEIVTPQLGIAANPLGERPYPYGGIYDTATLTSRPLPEIPFDAGDTRTGVIGSGRVWTFDGWSGREGGRVTMLDALTGSWIQTPDIGDHNSIYERRNMIGTDKALMAVGGERWSDDPSSHESGTILDDAWMLTFDRR